MALWRRSMILRPSAATEYGCSASRLYKPAKSTQFFQSAFGYASVNKRLKGEGARPENIPACLLHPQVAPAGRHFAWDQNSKA